MVKRHDFRVHLPAWMTRIYSEAVWVIPNHERKVFLTFDDGPVPEVTPIVLDILKSRDIKATFFCVGENVFHYPELFERIIDEGHAIGNHTYHHTQGMKCSDRYYFQDIEQADRLIGSCLFRPPHGLMSLSQYQYLSRRYQIIMWDVISCDYDQRLTPEHCFCNVVDFIRDGSIITFHDSERAQKNVLGALPRTIDFLLEQGYRFDKIDLSTKRPLPLSGTTKHWLRFKERRIQTQRTA